MKEKWQFNNSREFQYPNLNNEENIQIDINKETGDLKNTTVQIDLSGLYKHATQQNQNIHSSQMHMEHPIGGITLSQQVSLNKVKKIDFIQSTFTDYRKIIQTLTAEEKLENSQVTAHSQTTLQRRNQKERKYLETNKNVNTTYQNLWAPAKVVVTGKFILINTNI